MEKKFIRVDEVARELDISISHAYKKGFVTVSGRLNRQYFNERLYGAERKEEDAGI